MGHIDHGSHGSFWKILLSWPNLTYNHLALLGAPYFLNYHGYIYKTSISVKVVWLPFPIHDVSEPGKDRFTDVMKRNFSVYLVVHQLGYLPFLGTSITDIHHNSQSNIFPTFDVQVLFFNLSTDFCSQTFNSPWGNFNFCCSHFFALCV